MSIDLRIDGYCQDCSHFEPEVDTHYITSKNRRVPRTIVTCEHRDKCANIYYYIKNNQEIPK